MRLELFSDSYWLLAEVRWLARYRLIGSGVTFAQYELNFKHLSKIMSSSVGTIEVTNSDLRNYAASLASLAFGFAHGAMIRFTDNCEEADSFAWAALVLEGISQQLYELSGLKDEYGYETSKELAEEFRADGYTEVDIDVFFGS